MSAFFKREFKSYFTSLAGIIFMVVFLVILGIYTLVMNFFSGFPDFEYTLSSNTVMLMLLIPILTMRIFTEDKQKKITPLLASLPVPAYKQALAKFLACVAVYSLPMLFICLYPVFLSFYGTVNFASAYLGVFGYWLLGIAMIAIGMFLSSLTESPVISAVSSFGVFLFTYLAAGLSNTMPTGATASLIAFALCLIALGLLFYYLTKSWMGALIFTLACETVLIVLYLIFTDAFAGLFAACVAWLSIFNRYASFYNGFLSLADVFYYLSLTGVFLFLSVLSAEKQRWA
jgi:ABC-2 type transport system permease protein